MSDTNNNTPHISAAGFHITTADIPHNPDLSNWTFQPTNKQEVLNIKGPEPVNVQGSVQAEQVANLYRANAISYYHNMQKGINEWKQGLSARNDTTYGKINVTDYIDTKDAYTKLSDGTYLPNYTFYNKGIDNETRNSIYQTDAEKVYNSFTRLAQNSTLGILDIVDSGWSVIKAIFDAEASLINDRSALTDFIEDFKASNDIEHRNYFNAADRNAGIGFNLKTLDEVSSGLEYTTRMITGEAALALLTGGTSLAASAAKVGMRLALKAGVKGAVKGAAKGAIKGAGKAAVNGLSKATLNNAIKSAGKLISQGVGATTKSFKNVGLIHNVSAATINSYGKIGANIGKHVSNIGFGLRTAHAEARLEARHFREEAFQNFLEHGYKNGFTDEDITNFNKRLSSASDAVYLTNMAALGISNLLLFKKINPVRLFSKPLSLVSKPLAAKFFGEGVKKAADGTFKALTPNFAQKMGSFMAKTGQNVMAESVVEEGTQMMASTIGKAYVEQAYNPAALNDLVSFTDYLGYALDKTYRTEEGQHELAISMIVGGLLGAPGNLKAFGSAQKNRNEMEASLYNDSKAFMDRYFSDTYTKESILRSFGSVSRAMANIKEAEAHGKKGDDLGQMTSHHKAMFSLMERAKQLGKDDYVADSFIDGLNRMDLEEYAEFNGISVEEAKDHRDAKIKEFKQIQKTYNDAYEVGEAIFGKGHIRGLDKSRVNPQDLVNAYAYLAATSESNRRFAKDSLDTLQLRLVGKISTENLKGLTAYAILQNAAEGERLALIGAEKDLKDKQDEITKLKKEIEQHVFERNEEGRSPEAIKKSDKVVHELTQQLAILQEQHDHIKNRAEALRDAAIKNYFGKDGVENFDIDAYTNFNESIEKFKEVSNRLNLSVREKAEFDTLFDYFERASKEYNDYLSITSDMINPEVQIKTFEGMFSGLANGEWRGISDKTREALERMYDVVDNTKLSRLGSESYLTPMTDDEKEEFENRERWDGITDDKTDPYITPEEIDIRRVAKKIAHGKPLTENEEIFYYNFKDEIDQKIDDLYGDPLTSDDEDTLIKNVAKKIEEIDDKLKNLALKKVEVENGEHPDLQEISDKEKKVNETLEKLKAKHEKLLDEQINKIIDIIRQEAQTEVERIQNSDLTPEQKEEALKQLAEDVEKRVSDLLSKTDSVSKAQAIENSATQEEFVTTKKHRQKQIQRINGKIGALKRKIDKLVSKVNELFTKPEKLPEQVIEAIKEKRIFTAEITDPVKGTTHEGVYFYVKEGDKITFYQVNPKTGKVTSKKSQASIDTLLPIAEKTTSLGLDKLVKERENLQNESTSKTINVDTYDSYKEVYQAIMDMVKQIPELRQQFTNVKETLLNEIDEEIKSLIKEKSILEEIPNIKKEKDDLKRQIQEEDAKVAETFNIAAEDQKRNNGVRNEDLFDEYRRAVFWRNYLIEKLHKVTREWTNQKRKQPYDPDAPLEEQVDWIVENIYNLGFTSRDELEDIAKIPESDVERYKELSSKVNNLTPEEEAELEKLSNKLDNYFVLDNANVDPKFNGLSILDIVRLWNQTKKQSQLSQDQDFNIEEHIQKVEDNLKNGFSSSSVGKVYWGSHVSKKPKGLTQYHHVKAGTIIDAALAKGYLVEIIIDGKKVPVDKSIYPLLEMTSKRYTVTIQGSMYPIVIQRQANSFEMLVREKDGFTVADLLDAYPLTIEGKKPGFTPLYVKDAQGNLSVRPSDIVVEIGENAESTIEFDYDALDNLNPDDEVYLRFEPNATYNIHLAKNATENRTKDFVEKGLILIEDAKGRLLNVLPAMNNKEKTKQSKLAVLRQKAVEAGEGERIPVKIEGFYEGIPNITFTPDMKPVQHTVKSSSFIDYGYSSNGTFVTKNNTSFITDYIKDGQPFIVVKQGTSNVALPVKLSNKNVDTSTKLQNIYNNSKLTASEKALRMNEIIAGVGNLNNDTMIGTHNVNDQLAVNDIINQVHNSLAKVDFTNLDNFNQATMTTHIDPNKPLSPRKLKFDFGITTGRPTNKGEDATKIANRQNAEHIFDNICGM